MFIGHEIGIPNHKFITDYHKFYPHLADCLCPICCPGGPIPEKGYIHLFQTLPLKEEPMRAIEIEFGNTFKDKQTGQLFIYNGRDFILIEKAKGVADDEQNADRMSGLQGNRESD